MANPARAANDDAPDTEAEIRAAFEAAEIVRLPARPGGGGGDDRRELAFAYRPRNDIGNAERFIGRRGEDFFWVRDVGCHAWTGTHWSRSEGATRSEIAALRGALEKLIKAVSDGTVYDKSGEASYFNGPIDEVFACIEQAGALLSPPGPPGSERNAEKKAENT